MPVLDEATREKIAALPNRELVSYHHRLHQIWGNGRQDESVRSAHRKTVAEMRARGFKHHQASGLDDGVWVVETAGGEPGSPELGAHQHNLERNHSRTRQDGAHLHAYLLPTGKVVYTAEDGEHEHALSEQGAGAILPSGRHRHAVRTPEGDLQTELDGEHGHDLEAWRSTFSGTHTHSLKLQDGTTLTSLTAGQVWERDGRHPADESYDSPAASALRKGYYDGMTPDEPSFIREIAEVMRHVEGENCLVLGCGNGRELGVLSQLGLTARGVDTSEEAVKLAQEAGHEAFVGDACKLDETWGGHYDTALSMHTMEHVDDFKAALAESLRVARKKVIHLVPLGRTDDPTHKLQFPTLGAFRDAVEATGILKDAHHFYRRPVENAGVLVVDKTLPLAAPVVAHLDDFVVVPEFISLAGGSVKHEDPADIDLVVRSDRKDPAMELAVRNLLPRDSDLRDRLQFVYNRSGPHDDAIPLYDLIARFNPRALRLIEKAAGVHPGRTFTPVKPSAEFTGADVDLAWEKWAAPLIRKGTNIEIEEKANGWRVILGFGDKPLIYFEDSKKDRTSQFPSLVSDLKALGKSVVLDGDFGVTGSDGRPWPRIGLSGFGQTQQVPESGKVSHDGETGTLRVRVWDCLYLDGQDLHAEPWHRRREALESVFADVDFRFLDLMPKRVVRNEPAFKAAWRELSAKPMSEGVVGKAVNSPYELDGTTSDWFKAKLALEVKVQVLDAHKKGAGYTYTVGVQHKGEVRRVGDTFVTSVKAKPGDILTLAVQEVIPKDDGFVSFVVPKVLDLASQDKPETAESILSRADKFGVLQKSKLPDAKPGEEVCLMLTAPPEIAEKFPASAKRPHFTILYIGSKVSPERRPELLKAVGEVIFEHPPVQVGLDPTLLWFTAHDGGEVAHVAPTPESAKILTDLHTKLRNVVSHAGFEIEHASGFTPHATLAISKDRVYDGPIPDGGWLATTLELTGWESDIFIPFGGGKALMTPALASGGQVNRPQVSLDPEEEDRALLFKAWDSETCTFDWFGENHLPWETFVALGGLRKALSPEAQAHWRNTLTLRAQSGYPVPTSLPDWATPDPHGLTQVEAAGWQLWWADRVDKAVALRKAMNSSGTGLDRILLDVGAYPGVDLSLRKQRAGNLSFKEGDEGEGILQIHERGLSEFQAKKLGDRFFFGWDQVEVTEGHLSTLRRLVEGDWASALAQAVEGNSAALGKLADKAFAAATTDSDRKAAALVQPVSIHTDFRLARRGDEHWEGGEGFTPGNQFGPNKFRQIAEREIDPTKKVLMNFKVARVGEGEPTRGGEEGIIRGPLVWLKIGRDKPEAFEPGAVGSTASAWSRFKIVGTYKWRAGKQDEHFKEFHLSGAQVPGLNGRWIFQFAPTSRGRQWMASKPAGVGIEKSLVFDMLKREDQRIVTGVVLVPGKVDAHGDVFTPEAVEQSAYSFLDRYRRFTKLGVQHSFFPDDEFELLESWLLKEPWTINGRTLPAGTWMMSVRVKDDRRWADVKAGKFTGFSIGATGSGYRVR